jgi:glutathione S-transferase
VLLRTHKIAFTEHLLRFGAPSVWESFREICPSGKVPCLIDGSTAVWDSLAITEYLAERHAGIWPGDSAARAWARSAAAEMHSGFNELRSTCSMNCGARIRLSAISPALARDLERLTTLWADGLTRFGGPFLAGPAFTAVDAFFAPVAFRLQTYGLDLGGLPATYGPHLLELAAMRDWYADALREPFRDLPHEAEIPAVGTLTDDLRVPVQTRD